MSTGIVFDLSKVKNKDEIHGVLATLVQMDMHSEYGLEEFVSAALEDEDFLKAQLKKMASFYIEAVGLQLPEDFEIDFEKVCNTKTYQKFYQELFARIFKEWTDHHEA